MSNILVSISSIPGEATGTDNTNKIACFSMRHTVNLPVKADTATRTEGSSVHGALELVHTVDKATPLLREAAMDGTNLGEVTITRMGVVDGTEQVVETITLQNVYITRVDLDAPVDLSTMLPADDPMETFAMEYSQIVWNNASGNVTGGWSIALSKKAS